MEKILLGASFLFQSEWLEMYSSVAARSVGVLVYYQPDMHYHTLPLII